MTKLKFSTSDRDDFKTGDIYWVDSKIIEELELYVLR